MTEIQQVLSKIKEYVNKLVSDMEQKENVEEIQNKISSLASIIQKLEEVVPTGILAEYAEFFDTLKDSCNKCMRDSYFSENYELMYSSVALLAECMDAMGVAMSYVYEIDRDLCENGPLVSVILPCYNHEKYVARAIESVINQSYKNIEFIVADDGSDDKTPDIMKRYSEYYSAEWYFDKNRYNREYFMTLINRATGKYIALMHSDDIWENDKIAIQVQYMEQHEECGACLTWCKLIDRSQRELEWNNIFIQPNRDRYEWMAYFWEKGNALCNPSSLTRTEIFKNIQIHGLACRQLPDYFKWIDMVQKYNIHIIPKILTRMTWHTNDKNPNTSADNADNRIRHVLEHGMGWYLVIRDMKDDFFLKSFEKFLVHKNASAKEEILCEKFFLLRNSQNVACEHSALLFFMEYYLKIQDCLEKQYHYSIKDFFEDELSIGFFRQNFSDK